jgi:hypothetical protein
LPKVTTGREFVPSFIDMPPLSDPVPLATDQQDQHNGPPVCTEAPARFYNFFDLPDELQLKILHFAHVSESKLPIWTRQPHDRTFRRDLSVQLLRVSKWFYNEGREILYQKNVFEIKRLSNHDTKSFLIAIGRGNRNEIKQLVVNALDRRALRIDQENRFLTQMLRGIRVIELEFRWPRIFASKNTQFTDYPLALAAVARILTNNGGYPQICCVINTSPGPRPPPMYFHAKVVWETYYKKAGVSSPVSWH